MIDPKISCHYCGALVIFLETNHIKKYEKMAIRQLSCGAYEFKSHAPHPLVIFHLGYLLPEYKAQYQSLQRKT